MNAFASQVVLSELRATAQGDLNFGNNAGPEFGLAAFVKMSATERLQRFERLLGGEKVLRNASIRLDSSWR
jgi:hypothetical protein